MRFIQQKDTEEFAAKDFVETPKNQVKISICKCVKLKKDKDRRLQHVLTTGLNHIVKG